MSGGSGYTHFLHNYSQDRGQPLKPFCIVFMVLPALAVVLRFWSRAVSCGRGRKFSYDDWFCLASLPFVLTQGALTLHWLGLGLGKHLFSVSVDQMTDGFRIFYGMYYIYAFAVGLPKISALFFYRRLFWPTSGAFNVNIWTLCVLNSLWILVVIASGTFLCTMVKPAWPPISSGHCLGVYNWNLGVSIVSVLVDLWILLLPIPILWALQAKLSRKLLILTVFVAGYCVIVVSIGRVVSISKAGSGLDFDLTWNFSYPIYWMICEGPISLISICMPNSFNLFRRGYYHGSASLFTDKEYATPGKSSEGKSSGNASGNTTVVNPARKFQRRWAARRKDISIVSDLEAGEGTFDMQRAIPPVREERLSNDTSSTDSVPWFGAGSPHYTTDQASSRCFGAEMKGEKDSAGAADEKELPPTPLHFDVAEQRRWTTS